MVVLFRQLKNSLSLVLIKNGERGRPGASLGRVSTIKAESLSQRPGFESDQLPFAVGHLSSLSLTFLPLSLSNKPVKR